MNRTKYQRLKRIFYSATEIEPNGRGAFLDVECAGDPSIRREIEKLLVSYDSEFLEAAAASEHADLILENALEPGQLVAHYEIKEKIASGGMGEVYLARDVFLERPVALKLLPALFTSDPDWVRRFQQEVRVASALNHPNILTIHEIGLFDDNHFIATEYIEGVTVRNKLSDGALPVKDALDIAIQVTSALDTVHRAGIVHRDIKPENIMVRADALVKVLDFGLAKVEAGDRFDMVTTTPGIVLGTVQYMSPEQVRQRTLGAGTDIWSMGVVLFEMLTGKQPFRGDTKTDIVADILTRNPPSVHVVDTKLPSKLAKIVSRALEKDRERRYATAAELLKDLQGFRAQFFSGEISLPVRGNIIQQVWSRRRVTTIAAVTLLLIGMASVFVFFGLLAGSTKAQLTDSDVVLIADFDNRTGDEIFDDALKRGLSIHLQQSPFFNLYPDAMTREAMTSINRSPDERVTREIGREISERRGLKVVIVGTIAQSGRSYILTLEAVDSQTHDVIASEQDQTDDREAILGLLSQLANKMRIQLGESAESIDRFGVPINLTTPSLPALKAASLAEKAIDLGDDMKAVSLLEKATEIDPNFGSAFRAMASAYTNVRQHELAINSAARAFELRNGTNEWDRFLIHDVYYSLVTKEIDTAIAYLREMKQRYPRSAFPSNALASRYLSIGEYEKAIDESNEALQRNSTFARANRNLMAALIGLNRFDEAKNLAEQAIQLELQPKAFRQTLLEIAVGKGDQKGFDEQVALMKGRADGSRNMGWEIADRMYHGRWKAGRKHQRFSNELDTRSGYKLPGKYPEPTLISASFGQCDYVIQTAPRVLATKPRTDEVVLSSTALAVCGDSLRVRPIIDQLADKYPKGSLVHQRDLPMIRAALELSLGNAQAAVELLWPVRRGHESTSRFWIQYLRGQALLKLNRGQEAAAEFQKIIDHRGEAVGSPLYPLAHLQIARAFIQTGEIEKARDAYQKFFEIWKDADADLPVLVQARSDYAKSRARYRWEEK